MLHLGTCSRFKGIDPADLLLGSQPDELSTSQVPRREDSIADCFIERPTTGPINDLDVRLLRPGLNGAVSGDGRFFP